MNIEINEKTLINLAAYTKYIGANSMGEAIDTLLNKNLSEKELIPTQTGIGKNNQMNGLEECIFINGDDLHHNDLRFAKILSATIDMTPITRCNWKNLLEQVLVHISSEKNISGVELQPYIAVPTKDYEFPADGYSYYPKIGLSIQGQSATDACKEAYRLCKFFDISMKVIFIWREHQQNGKHPGKNGIIEFLSKKN